MEEKQYKIEVFVKSITKDSGEKFRIYSAKINNGTNDKKYVKIKFTKSVLDMPKMHSYIYVKESKLNYDNRDEKYPCYWVSQIEKIEIIYPDYEKYFTKV